MLNGKATPAAAWSWAPPEPVLWSAEMARLHEVDGNSFSGTLDDYVRRIHAMDRDHFETGLWRTLEQKEASCVEYRVMLADQSHRWLATTMYPDSTHSSRRVHGVCWDVTDTKLSLGTIRRASDATPEVEEVLRMAACAIHDLRNPLNTLLIRTAAMLRQAGETSPPDGWRTSVETVCRSVQSIQRAAADWEVYHRTQIGAPVIDPRPTRVGDLIEEIVHALRTASVSDWPRVEMDRVPDGATVACDPKRMAHALLNLAACAGARALRADDARLRYTECAGNIEISIERPIHSPSVLESGTYSVESVAKRKPLPLLVAEKIIHAHQGRIITLPGQRPDVAFSLALPSIAGVYGGVRTA